MNGSCLIITLFVIYFCVFVFASHSNCEYPVYYSIEYLAFDPQEHRLSIQCLSNKAAAILKFKGETKISIQINRNKNNDLDTFTRLNSSYRTNRRNRLVYFFHFSDKKILLKISLFWCGNSQKKITLMCTRANDQPQWKQVKRQQTLRRKI